MTLRNWMNDHFFDDTYPYQIIENNQKLNIGWDEYINYKVLKVETIDREVDKLKLIYVERI
ncbi:hypothetical protein FND36_10070 [Lachnospiraceae bacterium KGMB03038]|nr:hypothetical protein FND36_10070 [Lachnospiraceae bacterium KGMB03038]